MDTPDLRAEGPMVGGRPAAAPEPEAPPPAKPPRRKRRWFVGTVGFLVKTAIVLVVAVGLAGAGAAWSLYRNAVAELPDYRWLADYQPPQMSRIYAADSRLMAELAQERRVFIPIEAIPQRLQQAFVSAEDQRFWTHHGVDPIGIFRTVLTNVEQIGSGRRMAGASTITQQVAKNMLVGAERSLTRKVREAILALRIEQAMPKSRILEIYLNEIFLGQQAYGVAAAAQNYFNKSLDELSLAESAFLAALPKAPNNYNPIRFPEAAKARRDWVLERMAEDGAITREEAARARAEPLVPRPQRRPDMVAVGQHFTEEVRRELITRFGVDQTTMGGLVVRTSLDPNLQAEAEKALRNGLLDYDRRRGGWRGPVARISANPTEWLPALQAVARPPGIQPGWRLAVALEVRDREARLAWLERPDARTAPQPRTGTMYLEDIATWARPVRDGRMGPPLRRMQEALSPGDVVMVETLPAVAAQPPRVAARPERLMLRQLPEVEGAVVALDPNTGRVLAMVGGFSFERSWFNRASQAMRQPGSSFKPYVYLAGLEAGIPPNQLLLDAPVEIMTPQGMWRPGNYGGGAAQGWVTMRSALERSLNLVTIRLAQQVGMPAVADVANRFGVIPNMPRVLAMSLGAGETTVLRQAAGYASFVNGGRQVIPTLIDSVQDRHGRLVWRTDARECSGCNADANSQPPRLSDTRRQIVDPVTAFQMTSLLQGVVQRGTGTRAAEGLNRPVAGKTGTTDDYKDAWFVGFTPDLVVAVWVGFDEPRTLRLQSETGADVTGGRLATPIFRDVVAAATQGSPPIPFRAPPGVALVRLQLDNGQTILEAFRPGTENSARPPSDPLAGAGAGTAAAGLDSNLGGLY